MCRTSHICSCHTGCWLVTDCVTATQVLWDAVRAHSYLGISCPPAGDGQVIPVNGFQETGLCPSLVGILCCIRTSFSTKVIRSGTTRFDLLFWHTQVGQLCASVRFITVCALSSVGPILSQLNTVNNLRIHSCLIHFSSILSWTPMSPEGSRPLCFPVRTEYHLMYHICSVHLILIG